jgi:mannose-6-phosphate isomerase
VIEKIENQARDYAWGSTTLLADELGFEATGGPMAEVWFGTHSGSPAQTVSGVSLAELRAKPLGFLLKFLAAAIPLSIQVHPSRAKAIEGFARENAAGLEVDHPNRSYKDENPKSESLVAITEFEVLAGIRPASEVRASLESLRGFVTVNMDALEGLIEVSEQEPDRLFGEVLNGEADYSGLVGELVAQIKDPSRPEHELLQDIFAEFGADKGALLALFMRHFLLQPGEALVVPPGTPHSYIRGLGLEIQDNSDNVLRAGLTPKLVDGGEFLHVLDIEVAKACEVVRAKQLAHGLFAYPAISDDYSLHRVEVSGQNLLADIKLPGDSIVVCISGEIAVSNSLEERVVLRRGEAAYVTADANFFTFAGSGVGYIGSEL